MVKDMIKLEIEMDDKGGVKVNGPIQDKIFCYGLLQVARDIIKDYRPEKIKVVSELKVQ
jgi:hypothetical protein